MRTGLSPLAYLYRSGYASGPRCRPSRRRQGECLRPILDRLRSLNDTLLPRWPHLAESGVRTTEPVQGILRVSEEYEGVMESATAASARAPRVAARSILPWQQQPGENALWFARFIRYLALGPGRSVSLVAVGRRNAYPVPAHWPAHAKQADWNARGKAFDKAARSDPSLIATLNETLAEWARTAPPTEGVLLLARIAAGGYIAPPPDEDEEDTGT